MKKLMDILNLNDKFFVEAANFLLEANENLTFDYQFLDISMVKLKGKVTVIISLKFSLQNNIKHLI